MKIKVLIADDHRMVREGLKQLLEMDGYIEVIAEADDGYECLNLINKTHPDIVLLDINMPNLDGLKVLSIMKSENINTKVVMLTIHKESEYIMNAINLGCKGYILKDSSGLALKNAVLAVYNGETYIEPSLITGLNSKLAEKDKDTEKIKGLTKREYEVLKLLSSGLFNKEIASKLNISERTVKNHISNIFRKIDVSDRTQAAVFAIKNNIISIH